MITATEDTQLNIREFDCLTKERYCNRLGECKCDNLLVRSVKGAANKTVPRLISQEGATRTFHVTEMICY